MSIFAIIGSRTFSDYSLLKSTLSSLNIREIVSGGARGADSLAEQYASENSIKLTIFKPDWGRYGKGAGVVRNTEIINYADSVVAFWDEKSKGTLDSINKSKKLNKPTIIITYDSGTITK